MSKIEIRKGFVKMARVGPVKFHRQKGVPHAPENWGIWAFPYPFQDEYFTSGILEKYLPISLRKSFMNKLYDEQMKDDITDERYQEIDSYLYDVWDRRDAWIAKHKHSLVKTSTFWYKGDMYTHISQSGEVLTSSDLYHIIPPEWSLLDTSTYKKLVDKTGPSGYTHHKELNMSMRCSTSYLEVFIPRNKGIIKHNEP